MLYRLQKNENRDSNRFTPMLTLALFIIAKRKKQPKHLSADEWITKNGLCAHTGILFNHKKG